MGQGLGRLVGHWDRLGPRRAPSAQVRLQQFAGGAQVLEPRLAVSEQRQHRMVLFGVVRTWVARQRVVCVPQSEMIQPYKSVGPEELDGVWWTHGQSHPREVYSIK